MGSARGRHTCAPQPADLVEQLVGRHEGEIGVHDLDDGANPHHRCASSDTPRNPVSEMGVFTSRFRRLP